MRWNRYFALFAAGLMVTPALAAPVVVPAARTAGGDYIQVTPVIPVDTTGAYVATGYTGPVAAQLPAALGATTSAASLSVAPATDAVYPTVGTPSAAAANAIAPSASTAAESSHIAKASAGNLYRVAITTGGTAGYLMAFNAVSAPADGAVTPLLCRVIAANASLTVSFAEMPARYGTGITFVFSSTGCLTKTASATAFFEWSVQ